MQVETLFLNFYLSRGHECQQYWRRTLCSICLIYEEISALFTCTVKQFALQPGLTEAEKVSRRTTADIFRHRSGVSGAVMEMLRLTYLLTY